MAITTASMHRDRERGSVSIWLATASLVMIILVGLAGDLVCQRHTHPPDRRRAFADAYRQPNRAWVKSINTGKPNLGASAWDGYCSTAVAEAGVEALHSGKLALVKQIAKPIFYW